MTPAQQHTARNLITGNTPPQTLKDSDLILMGCAIGGVAPDVARNIEEELAKRLGVDAQSEMTFAPPPNAAMQSTLARMASAKANKAKLAKHEYWRAMPDGWFTVTDMCAKTGKDPQSVRRILWEMKRDGLIECAAKRVAQGDQRSLAQWRKHPDAAPPKPPEDVNQKWLDALTDEWVITSELAKRVGMSRGRTLDRMRALMNDGRAQGKKVRAPNNATTWAWRTMK